MSSFKPQLSTNHDGYQMMHFTPNDANGVIQPYDFVRWEASDNTVRKANGGATVLGIAHCATADAWLYEGRILVAVLIDPKVQIELATAVVPGQAHIGRVYSWLEDAAGNAAIDLATPMADRWLVKEIDAVNSRVFASPSAAMLEFDAIAS